VAARRLSLQRKTHLSCEGGQFHGAHAMDRVKHAAHNNVSRSPTSGIICSILFFGSVDASLLVRQLIGQLLH